MAIDGELRIRDRRFPLTAGELQLIVRRRPTLRLELDLSVDASDGDWEPVLKAASDLVVPVAPFAGAGPATVDVPLKDEAGSSFNLMLYVFEHAPVKNARLSLAPAGAFCVRVGLEGVADVRWSGDYDRDVPLSLNATLPIREVAALTATSEAEARALCRDVGLPELPPGPGRALGPTWRLTTQS